VKFYRNDVIAINEVKVLQRGERLNCWKSKSWSNWNNFV